MYGTVQDLRTFVVGHPVSRPGRVDQGSAEWTGIEWDYGETTLPLTPNEFTVFDFVNVRNL